MKTTNSEDKDLVRAFQAGDKFALTKLIERWHIIFCKRAYWIVKDAELSKDIAQDSWQTIMSKIGELKDVSRFNSWALRIVYNKSLDALKYKTRERKKHEEFSHTQLTSLNIHGEDEMLKVRLLEAIKQLSMQQQMVIKLFYTESYSLKEISELLNISIGTAKSRLFHAREKLKTIIKT